MSLCPLIPLSHDPLSPSINRLREREVKWVRDVKVHGSRKKGQWFVLVFLILLTYSSTP